MAQSVSGVVRYGRSAARAFSVSVGGTYRVDPIAPQKRRHRGRLCTVLVIREDGAAEVRFADNGRRGVVEAGDLVAPPVQADEPR